FGLFRLFYVEHFVLFARFGFIFLGILLMTACNRPNPNPELLDPIYADLGTEMNNQEKEIAEEQKGLDEAKKRLKNAAPQTGDAKRAFMAMERIQKKIAHL